MVNKYQVELNSGDDFTLEANNYRICGNEVEFLSNGEGIFFTNLHNVKFIQRIEHNG